MTEEQGVALLDAVTGLQTTLSRLEFFALAVAVVACYILAFQAFRLWLQGKNSKNLF